MASEHCKPIERPLTSFKTRLLQITVVPLYWRAVYTSIWKRFIRGIVLTCNNNKQFIMFDLIKPIINGIDVDITQCFPLWIFIININKCGYWSVFGEFHFASFRYLNVPLKCIFCVEM